MCRALYALYLVFIDGLLVAACVGSVLSYYIRRGELDTALFIVQLIAGTVIAAVFFVTAICAYHLMKMLLTVVKRTIQSFMKMLITLVKDTIQTFMHLMADLILLLLTIMLRAIYPLLLATIDGLLAVACASKVTSSYINWRQLDTASFIAELAAVTALAGLFCVAIMCLYRLLKILLFLVKTTLLIFYRLHDHWCHPDGDHHSEESMDQFTPDYYPCECCPQSPRADDDEHAILVRSLLPTCTVHYDHWPPHSSARHEDHLQDDEICADSDC